MPDVYYSVTQPTDSTSMVQQAFVELNQALSDISHRMGAIDPDGNIVYNIIGGWVIAEQYIYSGDGDPTINSFNNGIVLGSSAPTITVYGGHTRRLELGRLSDYNAAIYGIIGYEDDGTTSLFELSDEQLMIGGWTLTDTTLESTNILIDSGNERIQSSDYVTGYAGAGFHISADLIETSNIACRGIFRTAVFQYDILSAVGGNLWVRSSDVLDTDMTALDASTLTIEGNVTFAVGDFLRIKDGTVAGQGDDEWLEVTNIASAPTYTVTRDKNGDYAADSNPAWKAGATVVNYGQSGDGGVYITSSEANAPYIKVYTQDATPWDGLTTRCHLGNLNGVYGFSADTYGIGIGDSSASDNYLTYDDASGELVVKGSIIVTSGSQEIVSDPTFAFTTSASDDNYWNQDDAQVTWGAALGENGPGLQIDGNSENNDALMTDGSGSFKYIPASQNDSFIIQARVLRTSGFNGALNIRGYEYDEDKNVLDSNSWGDLTASGVSTWETKTVVASPGQSDTHFVGFRLRVTSGATGGYARIDSISIIKDTSTTWRSSSDYTKIDGGNIYTSSITLDKISGASGTLTISSTGEIDIEAAEGVVVKSGGDVTIESGGDLKLESVTGGNAGEVQFIGNSRTYYMGTDYDNDRLVLYPDTTNTGQFWLGYNLSGASTKLSQIRLYCEDYGLFEADDSGGARSANVQVDSDSSGNALAKIQAIQLAGVNECSLSLKGNLSQIDCMGDFVASADSTYTLGTGSVCWSDVYGDAGVSSCSDIKYKKDIEQITVGLDFINALIPVQYYFKKTGKRPKKHDRQFFGFIAQEVEAALQDVGYTVEQFAGVGSFADEDNEVWKTLKYEQLIAPMVKAIQELATRIERLETP